MYIVFMRVRMYVCMCPSVQCPSCFVSNWFGLEKPKIFLGRVVPARNAKTVTQLVPKPCRAFIGPCLPKPGLYI